MPPSLLPAKHKRASSFSKDDIPFPETRAYVDSVLRHQMDYRHDYARELGYK